MSEMLINRKIGLQTAIKIVSLFISEQSTPAPRVSANHSYSPKINKKEKQKLAGSRYAVGMQ